MLRCLALASKGLGTTAPNPSVGAVLVYHNSIIGEGFTSPFGGNHAEVNCIESVKEKNKSLIKDATLYVTLEPCNHQGNTPPCTDAILKNEIKKVVIASVDDHNIVDGKGLHRLKENGVEIETGLLDEENRFLNRRYFTSINKKRPYIILKWAQTKNGYFAPIDEQQKWLTGDLFKTLNHKWRAEEQAILIGTKTAIIDNPSLTVRNYKGNSPIKILIDKDLKVSNEANIYQSKAKTIVFNQIKSSNENHIHFIQIDFKNEVLQQILNHLHQQKIQSVIIEGGAFTLNQFIKSGFWDEARIATNQAEWKEGIAAPKVTGTAIDNFQLENDSVEILLNTPT